MSRVVGQLVDRLIRPLKCHGACHGIFFAYANDARGAGDILAHPVSCNFLRPRVMRALAAYA